MAAKLNGRHNGAVNGRSNGGEDLLGGADIKEDILGLTNYSGRLENVLLALMRQQEVLEAEMRSEKEARQEGERALQEQLAGVGGEVARCRERTTDLEALLQGENEKRRREAEELAERMEREKQELQEYVDRDNQRMQEKLDRESAEMKERLDSEAKALKDKLEKESEANRVASEQLKKKLEEDGKRVLDKISSESDQLKENMESQGKQMLNTINSENDARKKEADEINRRMEQEKEELKAYMDNDSKNLKEKLEREKEELRKKMEEEAERLQKKLELENKERSKNSDEMKAALAAERKNMEDKLMREQSELQKKMEGEAKIREAKEKEANEKMEKTKESGRNETIELFKKVRKDLDDCKRENEELRKLLNAENDKRAKEAQAIQEKLEREKQELRDFIEKDKECLAGKMEKDREHLEKQLSDELEQQKKNKMETENRLKKNEEEKNEILQLYDKMSRENEARKRENIDLRDKLDQEKEFLFADFSRGTSQVKEQQERDNSSLVARLEEQRLEQEQREDRVTGDKEKLWDKIKEEELKVFKQNSRLQQGLSDMGKALEREKAARVEALRKEIRFVTYLCEGLHCTVEALRRASSHSGQYFCAVREEPYSTGGEEYLTFKHCSASMGGGMDPKSGMFTTVVAGCYMFSLTVCSQDMKKVLIALRRNGEEVGTLYDQNHNDNHRNSMAGQSLLLELEQGDRVQAYCYTFTGLHDKSANHLTQFLGFLVRPVPDSELLLRQ